MKRSRRLRETLPQVAATNVEYVPPTDAQIDAYVRALCESLAQQDPAYRDFEVRSGFGSYLKLLVKVAVKKMNASESSGSAGKESGDD